MQYVLDMEGNPKKEIIKMMDDLHLDHKDIDSKLVDIPKFFGGSKQEVEDPTAFWSTNKWLRYLVSRGFWIDSYNYYADTYAGSDKTAIVHLVEKN
jgi:hypothetical protein